MKLTRFPQLNLNLSRLRTGVPSPVYEALESVLRTLVRNLEDLQNSIAYVVNVNDDAVLSLSAQENVTMTRLSNTQLRISMRGSDNVVRSVTLTLS